jgi:hypothetical protein
VKITLGDELRTDDMTFACVLSLQNFKLELQTGEKPGRAIWVVDEEQLDGHDDIDQFVRDYRNGICRVEPRRFMQELRRVRKELYDFLGFEPGKRASNSS